jgi:hypothetical protein
LQIAVTALRKGCWKEGIVAKPGSQTEDSKEFPAAGSQKGERGAKRTSSMAIAIRIKIVAETLDQAVRRVEHGVLTK